MKDEPWRGDPHARIQHLEHKLANKRRELACLLRKNEELRSDAEPLMEALEALLDRHGKSYWDEQQYESDREFAIDALTTYRNTVLRPNEPL